jgi:hypothetical protein
MKSYITFFVLISFVQLTFSQTEKIIASEIKNVIVYEQGALVNRVAKVNIAKGKTTLVLNSLTSKLDPSNIQIFVENESVTLLSVNHEIDYLNKDKANAAVQELEDRKVRIADSTKVLKDVKTVYAEEKSMILANKSIGGDQNGVSVTELQNAANFFRSRLMDIEVKTSQVDKEILVLNKNLITLSQQLQELNAKFNEPTSLIKIVVSASSSVTSDINVSYIVNDASWSPNYDLRVKNISQPLSLTQKAKVIQNTNEDWKDVKLTLSTGNPSISNNMPLLAPYYLTMNNYYNKAQAPAYNKSKQTFNGTITGIVRDESGEPIIGCNVTVKGKNIGAITDLDGRFTIQDIASPNEMVEFSLVGYSSVVLPANTNFNNIILNGNDQLLQEVVVTGYAAGLQIDRDNNPPVRQKKEVIPVAIQKQQTTTDFVIDIPYSIPSDDKPYDVSMVEYNIPAEFSYIATPKLSDDVFLQAKIKDWTQYNLSNGNANIFFEGIYQGNSFLDFNSFSDTLAFTIGRDKDIAIERVAQKEFTSKTFLSNDVKELKAWDINIKNNKDEAISIKVEDHYPISKTDEIKVELLDFSGAERNKDTGLLNWKINVAPKQKKKLTLKYEVKYPKYSKVIIE